MKIRLHKNATTTPAIRKFIQESDLSERKLAEKLGISRSTGRRWKKRDFVEDKSHRFTDRFRAGGEGKPTGEHEFDKVCKRQGVEYRLIKPYRTERNGMVERFNGRIKDILVKTRFKDSKELEETLRQYMRIYNHWIPQRALGGKSPVEALKECRRGSQNYSRNRYTNWRVLTVRTTKDCFGIIGIIC